MLATFHRFGVIDVAGTLALALVHAAMTVAYLVPGLARGAAPLTPGRVSVVTYIDQLALPAWQIGFGVTTIGLLAALRWTTYLPWAHTAAAFVLGVYTSALWAGVVLSSPSTGIVSSVGFTAVLLWHISLVAVYSAALAAGPRRARHREDRA